MGGKRDPHRGASPLDETKDASRRRCFTSRDDDGDANEDAVTNHVTTFCPITIRIGDECGSDNEKAKNDWIGDGGGGGATEGTNHVTTVCPITIRIDECSSDNDDEEEGSDCGTWRNDNDGGGTTAGGKLNTRHQPSTPLHRSCTFPTTHSLGSASSKPPRPPQTSSGLLRPLGVPLVPSPSHTPSHTHSPHFLEVPDSGSELSTLKATAVRLNLRTRTSSFLEWQGKWLDNSRSPPQFPLPAEEGRSRGGGGGGGGDALTAERKERINEALDWLKTELKEMRSMDQHLARQLLSLRHDIHQLRLRRSCQEHRDLLDDVQSELEEQVEMSDVLDLPNDLTLNDTPLKQIGVTRMNIYTRRFSMC